MFLHKNKVFQLIDSKSIGGIETHVLLLSEWAKCQGINNEVLFLSEHKSNPLGERLTMKGIPWRYLPNIKSALKTFKTEAMLLATHGYKSGIIGRLLASIVNVPVVSTYHSGDLGRGKVRFYSWLDIQTSCLADQVMCVSADIRKRIPSPAHQIENFVKRHHSPRTQGKQIAFVGRLSEEKNPESFARITRELSTAYAIHMYGDGELKNTLRGYSHIIFHGEVQMDAHWNDIGLLCITSKYEGLPLAALEAMSRGIPVISYAIGGLPDLISHNVNGWLVSPDDEQAFVMCINEWANLNSVEKSALSERVINRVENTYTCDAVCPKIFNIYNAAIHSKKKTFL